MTITFTLTLKILRSIDDFKALYDKIIRDLIFSNKSWKCQTQNLYVFMEILELENLPGFQTSKIKHLLLNKSCVFKNQ